MKPIYFPYTFVPLEIAEAVGKLFGQMIVYQPPGLEISEQMADAKEKGLLDIQVPIGMDEEHVSLVVRDYRQWADIHAGNDRLRFASVGQRKDSAPFFNETSILKIKEDLQRKLRDTNKTQEETDSFFSAMVFLHMAHELDKQHHDIHSGIRQLDKMEHALMENLREGEGMYKNRIRKGALISNDAADFMVSERIEAWSALMAQAKDQNDISGLFLTGHQSVFNYMVENSSTGEMVLEVGNIPMDNHRNEKTRKWLDALMETIEIYIREPWGGSIERALNMPVEQKTGSSISLSLYVVPEENPFDLFTRLGPVKIDSSYTKNKTSEIINTVIGLIEV